MCATAPTRPTTGWRARSELSLIRSFWLASAFAAIGDMEQATGPIERLLGVASPLGWYAEGFEVEGARHLGNFSQAFSHLALIQAARIAVHERLEQLNFTSSGSLAALWCWSTARDQHDDGDAGAHGRLGHNHVAQLWRALPAGGDLSRG